MPINVIALAIFVHSTDALHTFVDFNQLGLVLQSKALLREDYYTARFSGVAYPCNFDDIFETKKTGSLSIQKYRNPLSVKCTSGPVSFSRGIFRVITV